MYDDEDLPSPSSADYLESPGEAKRKALMQKLEKQGLKDQVKQGADLQQLKLTLLKGQVDQKKDDKAKQQPENKTGKGGTKTREQEIASSKLTADAKPNAENLVQQGEQDEKAEEQLKADEVQSEDA
jgi:hypothetical protein